MTSKFIYAIIFSLVSTLSFGQDQRFIVLGGQEQEGTLRVEVDTLTAGINIYQYLDGQWVPQFHKTSQSPVMNHGVNLYFENSNSPSGYESYSTGYYEAKDDFIYVATTKPDLSTIKSDFFTQGRKVGFSQIVEYQDGTNYVVYTWRIENFSTDIIARNLKVFIGGDTNFSTPSNNDTGAGFWNAESNIVGASRFIPDASAKGGLQRNITFEAATPPSRYSSSSFASVKQQVDNNQLTNEINTSYQTDNGFALEWERDIISQLQYISIGAAERFYTKNITDVAVTAPTGVRVKAGESVDMFVDLENVANVAADIQLSALIPDQANWQVEILSPTTFILQPGEKGRVGMRVTCPSAESVGATASVRLNVDNDQGQAYDVGIVTVADVPTITSQPQDVFACITGNVEFNVVAERTQSSIVDAIDAYQWEVFDGTKWSYLSNNDTYSGVNTSTLAVKVTNPTLSGNQYRCIASNLSGRVKSDIAALTFDPYSILAQPKAILNCDNTDVQLAILDSGGGNKSYQWQKDGNNIDFQGADTSVLIIPAGSVNNGDYRCVVTSQCGIVISDAATVRFGTTPTTTAPPDQTVCEGTFLPLTATGTADSYLWDSGIPNGLPVPISETRTYVVTGFKDGCFSTDEVTITANPLPSVSAGPDLKVCSGQTVTLSGLGDGISYSWDKGVVDGVPFVPASTLNAYTVTATSSQGCSAEDIVIVETSQPVSLIASDKSICSGESVDISVSATGGLGTFTYDWISGQSSIGSSENVNVSPTSTTNYTIFVTDLGFQTNDNSSCTFREDITVTVNPTLSAIVQDVTICEGETATLTAVPQGGNGNYSFIWSPGGVTTQSIDVTPSTTTQYTVQVSDDFASSNGTTCSASSTPATVTVNALPVISAGSNQSVCEGQEVTLAGSGGVPGGYSWDNDVIDGVAFIPPVGTTTYTVTGTSSDGCTNTASVDITVTALTQSNAGNGATICSDSYTLDGNTPTAGSGLWSTSETGITIVTPSDPKSAVNGLTDQKIYTLIWTITNGSCTSVSEVQISRDTPLPNFAGPDDQICGSTSYDLKAAEIAIGATGTWSGPVGVSFSNINDPKATVSNLPAGETTLTWTVSGNTCADSQDEVLVTRHENFPADAGSAQTICASDGSVTLAAVAPPAGTGTWSSTNPFVSFDDTTSPTANATGLLVGENTFIWTTVNGTCLNRDVVSIDVSPKRTVIVGPDLALCDTDELVVSGTNIPGGVWITDPPNAIDFDNTTFPVTTARNIPEGTTTVTWQVIDPVCGVSEDSFVLTRNITVQADAGLNLVACGDGETDISGNIPTKGIGLWSSPDPNVSFDDPSSPNTTIRGVANETVAFWTITNENCESSDGISITLNPLPNVSTNPPVTVCEGTQVTLSGIGADTYLWDNGVIDGKAFTPGTTTTYTLTGIDVAGCSNTAEVTVTVNPIPMVDAGENIEVCEGEEVSLTATGADTYSWTNGVQNGNSFLPSTTQTYQVIGFSNSCFSSDSVTVTVNPAPVITSLPAETSACLDFPAFEFTGAFPSEGVFSGNGITSNQLFDPAEAGEGIQTITFSVTDPSTNCTASADFEIIVSAIPTVTVLVDAAYCEDTPALFMADGASGYKWDGDSADTEDYTVLLPSGDFSIGVTGFNVYGCSSRTEASTNVEKLPNAGGDSAVVVTDSDYTNFNLFASLAGVPDEDGVWADLDNTNIDLSSPTMVDFTGVRHGNYSYSYTVTGDICPDSTASLLVSVDFTEGPEGLSVNNGFSPNGDNINDTWFIANIEDYPNNTVRILNRNGDLVFRTSGYINENNAFEGRSNAGRYGTRQLPEGTYFYILELGNGSEPKTGYITLIR